VPVTVRNNTARAVSIDPARIDLAPAGASASGPLAGRELERALAPGAAGDRVRTQPLRAGRVAAHTTATGYLVYPPGAYREARVSIEDVETGESEGFVIPVECARRRGVAGAEIQVGEDDAIAGIAALAHEDGVDPARQRERRRLLGGRRALGARGERVAEARERATPLGRVGAEGEERLEVARGLRELPGRDARREPELQGARVELLRVGVVLLEAVQQRDHRALVGRGRARGHDGAEERGARAEALVGGVAHEGAERGQQLLPSLVALAKRDDAALEAAETRARGEGARGNLRVLGRGVPAVAARAVQLSEAVACLGGALGPGICGEGCL